MSQIVIIGNGISGITAAREIRKKSDAPIKIISSESKYFFSRTALMYVYMGHMRFKDIQPYEDHFWSKNRLELVEGYVTKIDDESKSVMLEDGSSISYDSLIIATGSKPNKFGWPGENGKNVQGLYSKQDLERMELLSSNCKTAVIVGGGLIGVEMAEMFLSRNIEVHFLVRENHFWSSVLPKEDALLIMNHFKKHHGLHMHYATELKQINLNDNDLAYSIETKNGETIECQFVGLTAGVHPNIEWLKSSAIETNKGVLVNQYLETNIPNIYAIGDCVEFKEKYSERKTIEQVWYTGKIMGETVAKSLLGNRSAYEPGIWFNSAKFFDIEYQTYGWVHSTLDPTHDEFIWKNEQKELLLHFVFDKSNRMLIGVNTFGIRLRHELFDSWIRSRKSIEFVIENLSSANFDPEFYKRYEQEIIQQFNEQYKQNISLPKSSWWRNLITQ